MGRLEAGVQVPGAKLKSRLSSLCHSRDIHQQLCIYPEASFAPWHPSYHSMPPGIPLTILPFYAPWHPSYHSPLLCPLASLLPAYLSRLLLPPGIPLIRYPPHWVPLPMLVEAMSAVDPATQVRWPNFRMPFKAWVHCLRSVCFLCS